MLSDKDILYINDIVYKAGEEILKIYQTSFNVEIKSDKSPLTIADKNSHIIIKSGLEKQGIQVDHIPKLAQLAFEDSCHATHPFPVVKDDFITVYTKAL